MSVAVNLYVDRMSPVEPVRVADVYNVTSDRSSTYKEAASKMGLSAREYVEFRQALTDGAAIYVKLPRHIDAMAGVHHRSHQVYVLRNVVVPSDTMGWEVALQDGATVIIPQICANLSLNRSRVVAHKPAVLAHKPAVVAMHKQPKLVRAVSYVAPSPAQVAATPVTFAAPETVAPVTPFAGGGGSTRGSLLPFAALIFPIAASLVGGGGNSTSTPAYAPACSGGSNTMGVCAGK